MSEVDEIRELRAKKEKAQTLVTKYQTQLEGLLEERERRIERLRDEFGVALDDANDKIEELRAQRDELLVSARETLKSLDKLGD